MEIRLKVLGVTLARGGSKGVPKKNIKVINGKPLIGHTIEAALKSKLFTNYIVSTDSEEIADIARKHGASVPFMRPDELAQDHVWSRDSLKHAVLESERIYNTTYDYVVELPCVAPLRNEKHILEAFNKLLERGGDSVTSVAQMQDKHPVRMKRIANDQISDFCKEFPEGEASRRQDLEPCFIRNGAIFVMTRNCIVKDFSRHGKVCRPYIMEELQSVNIDTMTDFKLAEILLKERDSKIKVKIECPTSFLDSSSYERFLSDKGYHEVILNENVECLIVNPGTKKILDAEYFDKFTSLKVVGTPSTGVGHIDKEYLDKRGIELKCLLDDRETLENIHASAEFTWIHIMNAYRKFTLAINNKKDWRKVSNEDFLRAHELYGKRIGIVGMGRIGKKLANYAEAFGMNVEWYDPYVEMEKHNKVNNLNDLKNCDILSINCYLTDETRELITYGTLDDFKTGLLVVNTSRGEVVNEDYIYDLVVTDEIVYSTDVLCNEQDLGSLRNSKLYNLEHDNLTVTPHVAGATVESQVKSLSSVLKTCKESVG